MRMTELLTTTALQPQRTRRTDTARILTSGDVGKILPIKMIPVFREDAVQNGRVRVSVEMMETAEMLANSVMIEAQAHFVPFLAFEQFNGIDSFNRSYMKEAEADGSTIPFFEVDKYEATDTGDTSARDTSDWDTTASGDRPLFYQTLGLHHQKTDINMSYVQAYNAVVNMRREARSKNLTIRNEFDHSLAEAFRLNLGFSDIVSDYDEKTIDGQVNLSGLSFVAPVRSNLASEGQASLNNSNAWVSTNSWSPSAAAGEATYVGGSDPYFDWAGKVWAELTQGGSATMSLNDIEMAKKTAAMAEFRTKFDHLSEEYLIDLMLSGVNLPAEMMKQPMLLASKRAPIQFMQRYATDAGNLDENVANGAASLDLTVRLPRTNVGGIIVITASAVPESIWERKEDHFLSCVDPDTLPQFTRDYLDPNAVEAVVNGEIDVNHSTPDSVFGYRPLNSKWLNRDYTSVGGKYYRPADDAFTEVRSKIYSTEATNPTLNADWYLCTNMHKKVFADQVSDSLEISCVSAMNITGHTVGGERLIEATDDYDKVTAQVDQTRVDPS